MVRLSQGWTCIVAKGGRPEEYVEDWYSKAKFRKAYEDHIKPMPGARHWEPCSLPQPLPPTIRNMPGRPSDKKRKKEAGEVEEGNAKKKHKCSRCGVPGHTKLKCTKVVESKEAPKKGGRPMSNDPWVVSNKKKKEARANQMKYIPPSTNEPASTSQHPSCPPPQASQTASNNMSQQQPSVSNKQPPTQQQRPKLPTKSQKKKSLADL